MSKCIDNKTTDSQSSEMWDSLYILLLQSLM